MSDPSRRSGRTTRNNSSVNQQPEIIMSSAASAASALAAAPAQASDDPAAQRRRAAAGGLTVGRRTSAVTGGGGGGPSVSSGGGSHLMAGASGGGGTGRISRRGSMAESKAGRGGAAAASGGAGGGGGSDNPSGGARLRRSNSSAGTVLAAKIRGNNRNRDAASNMDSLSESELNEMRATFRNFDADDSGTIDESELKQIMQHLGHNMSAQDSAVLLQQVSNDPSRDGLVFEELVNLLMLFKETAQYKLLENDSGGGGDGQHSSTMGTAFNFSSSTSRVFSPTTAADGGGGGAFPQQHNPLSGFPDDSGAPPTGGGGDGLLSQQGSAAFFPPGAAESAGSFDGGASFRKNRPGLSRENSGGLAVPADQQQQQQPISSSSSGVAGAAAAAAGGGSRPLTAQQQQKQDSECSDCCGCCHKNSWWTENVTPALKRERPTDSFPVTAWHLVMQLWAAYLWFVPLLTDTNLNEDFLTDVVESTVVPTAIATAFLVLDIVVSMFLVSSPDEELYEWKANEDYLWRWLWLDIVSAIPWEWLLLPKWVGPAVPQAATRVFMHLKLLKLIRAAVGYYTPSHVVRSSRVYIFVHAFFVPVFSSSVLFICFVHLLAVVWTSVSDSSYTDSMLFAAYTVSGVGYGLPGFISTTAQRLLASAYCLIAPINVSIVVGSTITLLSQSNVAISNRHGVVETLRIAEMSKYNKAVTADMLGYRDHLNAISVAASHGSVMDCLPPALKRNINLFVKSRLIQHSAIFHMAHRTTQVALAQSLEDIILRPGQVICYVGESVSDMYMISHGKIALVDSDGDIVEFIYGGGVVNDIGLVRGRGKQTKTARAITHCDVFVLTRRAFGSVCKKFPVFGKAVVEVRTHLKQVEQLKRQQQENRAHHHHHHRHHHHNKRGKKQQQQQQEEQQQQQQQQKQPQNPPKMALSPHSRSMVPRASRASLLAEGNSNVTDNSNNSSRKESPSSAAGGASAGVPIAAAAATVSSFYSRSPEVLNSTAPAGSSTPPPSVAVLLGGDGGEQKPSPLLSAADANNNDDDDDSHNAAVGPERSLRHQDENGPSEQRPDAGLLVGGGGGGAEGDEHHQLLQKNDTSTFTPSANETADDATQPAAAAPAAASSSSPAQDPQATAAPPQAAAAAAAATTSSGVDPANYVGNNYVTQMLAALGRNHDISFVRIEDKLKSLAARQKKSKSVDSTSTGGGDASSGHRDSLDSAQSVASGVVVASPGPDSSSAGSGSFASTSAAAPSGGGGGGGGATAAVSRSNRFAHLERDEAFGGKVEDSDRSDDSDYDSEEDFDPDWEDVQSVLTVTDDDEDEMLELSEIVGTGIQTTAAEKQELAACEQELHRIERLLYFLEKRLRVKDFLRTQFGSQQTLLTVPSGRSVVDRSSSQHSHHGGAVMPGGGPFDGAPLALDPEEHENAGGDFPDREVIGM